MSTETSHSRDESATVSLSRISYPHTELINMVTLQRSRFALSSSLHICASPDLQDGVCYISGISEVLQ